MLTLEYTLARHPVHPSSYANIVHPSSYAKINEAMYDWYVLATSKNIFAMGPQLVEKAKQIDS